MTDQCVTEIDCDGTTMLMMGNDFKHLKLTLWKGIPCAKPTPGEHACEWLCQYVKWLRIYQILVSIRSLYIIANLKA